MCGAEMFQVIFKNQYKKMKEELEVCRRGDVTQQNVRKEQVTTDELQT